MKKLISITAVFLTLLVGCSNQENSITSPISSDNDQFAKPTITTLELTAVKEAVSNLVTTTKVIDGAVGGKLFVEQEVLNSEGKIVYAYSEFIVSAGAFVGTETITMTINVDKATVSFYPHMNFNQTCYLNYQVKYMNLDNLGFTKSDKKVDFVYFDDSGTIEPVFNMGANINYQNGSLRVITAEVNHFSRYGFIRVSE